VSIHIDLLSVLDTQKRETVLRISAVDPLYVVAADMLLAAISVNPQQLHYANGLTSRRREIW